VLQIRDARLDDIPAIEEDGRPEPAGEQHRRRQVQHGSPSARDLRGIFWLLHRDRFGSFGFGHADNVPSAR